VFRLLVDHDFNERILQGVQSRAEINAVLARTVGLEDKPDAALLGWAADENRIVLSHDRRRAVHGHLYPVYPHTPMRGEFTTGSNISSPQS